MSKAKVRLSCRTCGAQTLIWRSQLFGATPRYKDGGKNYQCRPCWNKQRKGKPIRTRRVAPVKMICRRCGKSRDYFPGSAKDLAAPEEYTCRSCYLHLVRLGEIRRPSTLIAVSCKDCGKVRMYKPSLLYRVVGGQQVARDYCITCKNKGSRNSRWKGGPVEYARGWGERLREQIRARDDYRCQLCFSDDPTRRKLCVHHIDYTKHNHAPLNLVSLCCSCHSKTNGGDQDEWIALFHQRFKDRGLWQEELAPPMGRTETRLTCS